MTSQASAEQFRRTQDAKDSSLRDYKRQLAEKDEELELLKSRVLQL